MANLYQPGDEPSKEKGEELRYVPLQAKVGDLAIYLNKFGYVIEFNKGKYVLLLHSAILMMLQDEELFVYPKSSRLLFSRMCVSV